VKPSTSSMTAIPSLDYPIRLSPTISAGKPSPGGRVLGSSRTRQCTGNAHVNTTLALRPYPIRLSPTISAGKPSPGGRVLGSSRTRQCTCEYDTGVAALSFEVTSSRFLRQRLWCGRYSHEIHYNSPGPLAIDDPGEIGLVKPIQT
jgi:hypothetical protein